MLYLNKTVVFLSLLFIQTGTCRGGDISTTSWLGNPPGVGMLGIRCRESVYTKYYKAPHDKEWAL